MQATSLRERKNSFYFAAVIALVMAAVPDLAFAQAAPWDSTAQNTYNLIMSIARWVAIICIVAAGLAAAAGKLSWDWVVKIVIGLVLIFGAAQLVDYFKSGMGG